MEPADTRVEPKELQMPDISVQVYPLREFVADDLDGVIARLKELGFAYVEPYAFSERVEDYARAFAATGVSAPTAHASVIDAAAPEAVFDAAIELGIPTVIDPYIPADRWATREQVEGLARRVNELRKGAAERGLELGYHNHNWEFAQRIDGAHAFDVFVERLDPEVALEVDTYWAAVGGADVPALLERLGDRVRAIHVKDGTLDGDVERQQPLGQGEVDLPAILRASGDALRVIEFDTYPDVYAGIAASLAWLKENDR
jgi:sugar phosphate isomerase/epimerase